MMISAKLCLRSGARAIGFLISAAIVTMISGAIFAADLPRVEIKTTMGTMILELYPDKAPRTVKNFLSYISYQYYDDMIFHRVVEDFVIQTGNYDKELVGYVTDPPIRNEAANGLLNERGTIAMARHSDPHSATSQFYINLVDNPLLDHKSRTLELYGYCVFGRVIEGMDVADAIGGVETHAAGRFVNLPVEPVIIERMMLLQD